MINKPNRLCCRKITTQRVVCKASIKTNKYNTFNNNNNNNINVLKHTKHTQYSMLSTIVIRSAMFHSKNYSTHNYVLVWLIFFLKKNKKIFYSRSILVNFPISDGKVPLNILSFTILYLYYFIVILILEFNKQKITKLIITYNRNKSDNTPNSVGNVPLNLLPSKCL